MSFILQYGLQMKMYRQQKCAARKNWPATEAPICKYMKLIMHLSNFLGFGPHTHFLSFLRYNYIKENQNFAYHYHTNLSATKMKVEIL